MYLHVLQFTYSISNNIINTFCWLFIQKASLLFSKIEYLKKVDQYILVVEKQDGREVGGQGVHLSLMHQEYSQMEQSSQSTG